jgi:hypothetical protein
MYYHMPTKLAVLMSLMRVSIDGLTHRVERALSLVDDPVERLTMQVIAHVLFHIDEADLSLVTDTEMRSLNPEARKEIVALRDAYEDSWRATLEAGEASSLFTVPDVTLTRMGLLQMCTGVAHWYNPGGTTTPIAVAANFAQIALQAVGIDPTRSDAVVDRCITELLASGELARKHAEDYHESHPS